MHKKQQPIAATKQNSSDSRRLLTKATHQQGRALHSRAGMEHCSSCTLAVCVCVWGKRGGHGGCEQQWRGGGTHSKA